MKTDTNDVSDISRRIGDILKIEHHAFLLLGDRRKHFEHVRHFLYEQTEAGVYESPDIWSREYESLAIDDARELKSVQNTMPNGSRRVVLISLQTIQHEAQNSLLKLFEEPASATTFIVCAENNEIFLPTVLSRFSTHDFRRHDDKIDARAAMEKFLHESIAGRMAVIESITKEKDREAAERFLNNLEMVLYEKKATLRPEDSRFVFNQIFEARRFLRSRSSSVKMILEHICGIIPVLPKK